MDYIIVDLEATCWQEGTVRDQMEIIEIGAVKLDRQLTPVAEFARFVRPVQNPRLSDFCRQLTSITQSQVDNADDFPTVFAAFISWIGESPFQLCSWGRYDFNQLRNDCQRHCIPFPFTVSNHINLKRLFATQKHTRPCGMKRALQQMGIPLQGTHHRGIDDARNIATIAVEILK